MTNDIVIFGAGGHAKVVANIAISCGYKIRFFVARDTKVGSIFGIPVLLESQESLNRAESIGRGIIAIGDNFSRSKVADNLTHEKMDFEFISIVSPNAYVAKEVEIGPGSVVMPGAVVNTDSRIGAHVIVNTSCSIDHECVLDDFSSVGPGATLGGGVSLGRGAIIALGAKVNHGLTIGDHALVGSGGVLLKSLDSCKVAVGVPAKVIKSRNPSDRYL